MYDWTTESKKLQQKALQKKLKEKRVTFKRLSQEMVEEMFNPSRLDLVISLYIECCLAWLRFASCVNAHSTPARDDCRFAGQVTLIPEFLC